MDSKKLVVWAIVAVAMIGLGTLMFSPAGGGAQDVSPERTAELVASGVRVIDVRTPGEFEAAHIPGAENVPMNTLQQSASGWDTSEPLLVYCATGARSLDAIRFLTDAGFETIYHFAAGIVAWDGDVDSGVQRSEPAETPQDVVPGAGPVLYVFTTDW